MVVFLPKIRHHNVYKARGKEITILSRYCNGITYAMGSWPEDGVMLAYYSEEVGVKDDVLCWI